MFKKDKYNHHINPFIQNISGTSVQMSPHIPEVQYNAMKKKNSPCSFIIFNISLLNEYLVCIIHRNIYGLYKTQIYIGGHTIFLLM